MKRFLLPAALCAALLPAPPAARAQATADPGLVVAFLSGELLAEAAAVVEAVRIATERLEGACLDARSGLVWTRSDNGLDVDWYAADQYCRDLTLGEWQDWRLPTIEELEALHDRRSIAVYKLPTSFLPTGCCPWSSTPSGQGAAWNFSFQHRQRFSGSLNYSFGLRALCVRAATAADAEFFELAAKKAVKAKRPYPWLLGVKRGRLRS